jgi:hypothetical protein
MLPQLQGLPGRSSRRRRTLGRDPKPRHPVHHQTPRPLSREPRAHPLRLFEEADIAVFPARRGTKGAYIAGWPEMTVAEALSLTRAGLVSRCLRRALRRMAASR